MERIRLIVGLASLALIVGSGILMTIYALERQTATVSKEEWQELQELVGQLVRLEEQHLAAPVELSVKTTPSETAAVESPNEQRDRIPINTADQNLLESLPGIGPVRAQAIVDARTQGGPFHDLDDLDARVSKIPNVILDDISPFITFDE